MSELTKAPPKGKVTAQEKHKIPSPAAPNAADRQKLAAMSEQERRVMYRQDLSASLKEPARKVTKQDLRSHVLKRLGIDG